MRGMAIRWKQVCGLAAVVTCLLGASTASGHTLAWSRAFLDADRYAARVSVDPFAESIRWSYLGAGVKRCTRESRHAFRCRVRVSYVRREPLTFANCFFRVRVRFRAPARMDDG